MTDLKTLLQAHAAGDWDAVLKGTEYEGATEGPWRLGVEIGLGDGSPIEMGCYAVCNTQCNGLVVQSAKSNAATAHVLTLLVVEMEKVLMMAIIQLELFAKSGQARPTLQSDIYKTLALAAMLKQDGV